MSDGPLWIGLDAGTSLVKAVLFDDTLAVVRHAARRTGAHAPRPLWSEVDPDAVWRAAVACLRAFTDGLDPARIGGIGVTGCMVGACLVDARHRPVRRAILHNDGRAQALIEQLQARTPDLLERVFATSGIALQQGCTLPVLAWLDSHEPEALDRAAAVLGMKDWLRLQLTGELAGDPTEAAVAPGDARTRARSPVMAELFGVGHRVGLLPAVRPSESRAGGLAEPAARACGLRPGTPVAVGCGDVPACALGAGVVRPGEALTVLGTTCLNGVVVREPALDGLPVGLHFAIPAGGFLRVMVNIAGTSNIDWATARFLAHLPEPERLAAMMAQAEASPAGALGLTWLPYLSGQGIVAPFLDPHARGALCGLEEAHGTAEILRAIHEGVAYAIRDCFEALGALPDSVVLAGGGGRSPFWSQMIADVLGRPVLVPEGGELGARGAALLATVAAGRHAEPISAAIALAPAIARRHDPRAEPAYAEGLARYRRIRDRLRGHGRNG